MHKTIFCKFTPSKMIYKLEANHSPEYSFVFITTFRYLKVKKTIVQMIIVQNTFVPSDNDCKWTISQGLKKSKRKIVYNKIIGIKVLLFFDPMFSLLQN